MKIKKLNEDSILNERMSKIIQRYAPPHGFIRTCHDSPTFELVDNGIRYPIQVNVWAYEYEDDAAHPFVIIHLTDPFDYYYYQYESWDIVKAVQGYLEDLARYISRWTRKYFNKELNNMDTTVRARNKHTWKEVRIRIGGIDIASMTDNEIYEWTKSWLDLIFDEIHRYVTSNDKLYKIICPKVMSLNPDDFKHI